MFTEMSTVKQGTVGVGSAIFEFCKRNWCVSIPINDTQAYDLIVDQGDGPKRVQVKTTRYKENSKYIVQLKSVRPNRTMNIIRNFISCNCDFLFVLCEDGSNYLIPTNIITAKSALTITDQHNKYKL